MRPYAWRRGGGRAELRTASTQPIALDGARRDKDDVLRATSKVVDLLELMVAIGVEGDTYDVDQGAIDLHPQLEKRNVRLIGKPQVDMQCAGRGSK